MMTAMRVHKMFGDYAKAYKYATPGFGEFFDILHKHAQRIMELQAAFDSNPCPALADAGNRFIALYLREANRHAAAGSRQRIRVNTAQLVMPVVAIDPLGEEYEEDDEEDWEIDPISGARRPSTAKGRFHAKGRKILSKRRARLARRKDPLSRLLVRMGDRLTRYRQRAARRRANRKAARRVQ